MPGSRLGLGINTWRARLSSGPVYAPPQNVVLVLGGTEGAWQLQADWDAPVDTPTNYTIQRRVDGGAWGNAQTVTHPTTAYTYSSIAPPGTYQIRVRANYAGGSSAFVSSNTVEAIASTASLLPVLIAGSAF